jgi:hypothetical protein
VLVKEDWYGQLLNDCKVIIEETREVLTVELLRCKWRLGDRILLDYKRFGRKEDGCKTQEDFAKDLGIKQQAISEVINFRLLVKEDFNNWLETTDQSVLSWKKIVHEVLPEMQRKSKGKKPFSRMYMSGNVSIGIWNPFYGCLFDCIYCKPSFQRLAKLAHKDCGLYSPHEHPERLDKIPDTDVVFVCSSSDISFIRPEYMKKIILTMREDKRKNRVWFIQSKNPKCINQYLSILPKNTYLITTIESNRDENYDKVSKAIPPSQRYNDFLNIEWDNKIVTIEPILDFDSAILMEWIKNINPEAVFIGLNSRPKEVQLNEPDLFKLRDFIRDLGNNNIEVIWKELRHMSLPDDFVKGS